ncbi:unnamed protein product [Peniophora sp. CBMAI 1063]|nr:unnamed protein product [Peniophora sp. CBMAI 1063]
MLRVLKRARSNIEDRLSDLNKRRRLDVSSFISTFSHAIILRAPATKLIAPPRQSAPRNLPDDVLYTIFDFVIEAHFTHLDALFKVKTSKDPAPPQIVLASVCRQWRNVALDMRRLWTDIPAGASSINAANYLARSEDLPLRLGMNFSMAPWAPHLEQPDFRKQLCDALAPFARRIVPTGGRRPERLVKRVRELAINVSPNVFLQFREQQIWNKLSFPDVEKLHISLKKTVLEAALEIICAERFGWWPKDWYNLLWVNSVLFPKLRHISIDGVWPLSGSLEIPWGLESLDITLSDATQRERQGLQYTPLWLRGFAENPDWPHHRLEQLSMDFGDACYSHDQEHLSYRAMCLPSLREIRLTAKSLDILSVMSKIIGPGEPLRRVVMSLSCTPDASFNKAAFRTMFNGIFTDQFRNFMSHAETELRSLCITHRAGPSGQTTTTILASAHPLDLTDPFSHKLDANLHFTLTCDARSRDVVQAFLGALFMAPAPGLFTIGSVVQSALHPFDTLALFSDDPAVSSFVCLHGGMDSLARLPHLRTLVCGDSAAEGVLRDLSAKPSLFGNLTTLHTPSWISSEAMKSLDALLRQRKGLAHVAMEEE